MVEELIDGVMTCIRASDGLNRLNYLLALYSRHGCLIISVDN